MIVVNEPLLQYFRTRPMCEHCGLRKGVEPHHVFGRGAGGGTRLDIVVNLIALCPGCHRAAQAYRIPQFEVISIVARREGLLVAEVKAAVYRMRQREKGRPETWEV